MASPSIQDTARILHSLQPLEHMSDRQHALISTSGFWYLGSSASAKGGLSFLSFSPVPPHSAPKMLSNLAYSCSGGPLCWNRHFRIDLFSCLHSDLASRSCSFGLCHLSVSALGQARKENQWLESQSAEILIDSWLSNPHIFQAQAGYTLFHLLSHTREKYADAQIDLLLHMEDLETLLQPQGHPSH
ncbi:hypothetical protein ACQKWADRAFT_147706 [Trichoderma austrokoningii]